MKKDIHPENVRMVIFHDNSSGEEFLVESTVKTEKTGKWEDGKEYPFFEVEISSASHPFFTGQQTVLDSAGRVQKFKARSEKASGKTVSKREKKAAKAAQRDKKDK